MMPLFSSHFPLPETYTVVTAAVASATAYIIYVVASVVIAYWSAPIWDLCGPKSVNWLTGSYERNVWEPDGQDKQLEWIREYGHVFRYYGWFNVGVVSSYECECQQLKFDALQMSRIFTTDLRALNHILNAPEFDKSDAARLLLGDILGRGWSISSEFSTFNVDCYF
jgi:hypothetical protein